MTDKENLLKQIEDFKNEMEQAEDKFFNTKDEEITEKFYSSSFEIVFNNNISGENKKVNLFICPETWETMQNIISNFPSLIEEYL